MGMGVGACGSALCGYGSGGSGRRVDGVWQRLFSTKVLRFGAGPPSPNLIFGLAPHGRGGLAPFHPLPPHNVVSSWSRHMSPWRSGETDQAHGISCLLAHHFTSGLAIPNRDGGLTRSRVSGRGSKTRTSRATRLARTTCVYCRACTLLHFTHHHPHHHHRPPTAATTRPSCEPPCLPPPVSNI